MILPAVAAVGVGFLLREPCHPRKEKLMIIDFRTYRLKPGMTDDYVRVVRDEAIPLLRKAGLDVVAFGVSESEIDGHTDVYLVRAFPSLDVMHEQEGAFYSSDAWLQGPSEAVVSRIESYHAVAIELSEQAVDLLRNEA